jgi:hypothetical protein
VEEISDEDMAGLRSAQPWPGRVVAAHAITREISSETQARLEAEQAAKINVPVLLVIGEESTDPAKSEVGAGRSRTTGRAAVGAGRATAHRRHHRPRDFREAPAGVPARPNPVMRG